MDSISNVPLVFFLLFRWWYFGGFTDLCRSSSWSPHAVCNSHEDLTQERTRYIYNLLQLNKRMMSYCISYHLSLPFSLPLPPSLSPSLSPSPPLSLSLSPPPPLSLSPLSPLPSPPLSLSHSLSLSLSLSAQSQARKRRRQQNLENIHSTVNTVSSYYWERAFPPLKLLIQKCFHSTLKKIFRPIFRIYAFELHIQFPSI